MALKDYQPLIDKGLVSKKTKVINGTEYAILCYTKEQFFNGDWTEEAIAARGLILDGDRVVNRPMPKIFNLNEHENTRASSVRDLMKGHEYELLDKLNGHLLMVSFDHEKKNVIVHTKGSMEGEFVDKARAILEERGILDAIRGITSSVTFSFEAIVEYDKHLYYEQTVKEYQCKPNDFILIAVDAESWADYDSMAEWAYYLQVKLVKRFKDLEKDMNLEELLTHKDIEGYVLHFPGLNHRVKLKTNDYFQKRYMKNLTVERFVDQFVSRGLTGMRVVNDEELYPLIDAMERDLIEYVFAREVDAAWAQVLKTNIEQGLLSKKEVFSNQRLNNLERQIISGKQIVPSLFPKDLRKRFQMCGQFTNLEQALESFLRKRLDFI